MFSKKCRFCISDQQLMLLWDETNVVVVSPTNNQETLWMEMIYQIQKKASDYHIIPRNMLVGRPT